MRLAHSADRQRDLTVAVTVVLGLSLAILAAAMMLRWLSSDWSAACHRLLHAPTPPHFGAPWRLSNLRPATPCLSRRS